MLGGVWEGVGGVGLLVQGALLAYLEYALYHRMIFPSWLFIIILCWHDFIPSFKFIPHCVMCKEDYPAYMIIATSFGGLYLANRYKQNNDGGN